MNWIPVTERLPDPLQLAIESPKPVILSEDSITLDNSGNVSLGYYSKTWDQWYDYRTRKWYKAVTHWQPTPVPLPATITGHGE